MTTKASALDFNQPDTAKGVGGELEQTSLSLAARVAVASPITDIPSLEQAITDRQMIGEAIHRVEDFFAPFKSMAHKLHRALCDRETDILSPLRHVDAIRRTGISDFKAAEDRARQQRERDLAAERRRQDEERATREAAALESSGEHAMAAAVVAEAIAAPAPVVVLPDATKAIEGLKFTRRWLYRVTHPDLVPREFLALDEKKLGAFARSMKASAKVAGVEFYFTDDPVR